MAKQKVRATRHNGRKGENGVFKAGHNDRSFDVDAAEHIDPSRSFMNVYWDMYQGYNIAGADGVRPERRFSFEEIEKAFYCSQFGDSLDAQTERHIKSRHKDRIRTMDQIREDPKTCPEETVYQLGTKDGHEAPALFVQVVAELVEEFTKRFGSHVQVLDWALHMDEATPHIHERHVFFADDGYGMNFPKQEKACEALGFERPNLEKKSNKFNNAKMVFDEEVRKLYIEIAEKYGVVIEKIPLEGKKHLEKNDYILAKQAEEIENNEARLQSLELKIEDVETFSEEVAKVAYEKACEVVAEEVRAMTIEEDVGIVEAYKRKIESDKAGIKRENKPFAIKLLNHVVELLKRGKGAISNKIEKALGDPASKKKNTDEIAGIAKASVLAKLKEQKEQVALADQQRGQTPAKKKEECL